eukprot:SAG31_NODE_6840_length_1873_cov_1.472943_2_plen_196_part_00
MTYRAFAGFHPLVLASYADTRLLLIKAGACMPQWYKKMVDSGESEQGPQNDGGYEFCQEEHLCQKVPEVSGQGFLGFKLNKEKRLDEIGDFKAPMFITERLLYDICPCSTDSWIAPEMCSHAESEEEYAHLVSEFKRWEDPVNGGVPGPRAIPPEYLIEFQQKIQRRNPELYAKHDTRPRKPSRHQMQQATKGAQ